VERGPEWVESTHGKLAVPDTLGAFPTGARRSLVISMTSATWDSVLSSLLTACGADGSSPSCTGSGLDAFPLVSAWHEADLVADGQRWATVGVRLPSNSEVAAAWKKGNRRFPWRITMDKHENAHPVIKNQRFYGFQKLSLSSLAGDSSLLRHQVASAVYRSAGLAAYRSTLVNLRLAHGAAAGDTLDLGIYSLREALDGPLLKRWFPQDTANLYEPSSRLASTYTTAEFAGDDNDRTYTDVVAFLGALHAANRTTAPDAWRANLRRVFDVDGFVGWLALSTTLGDHGSYGFTDDNYALFADQGRLHWLALDLDETLPTGNGLYRGVWHTDEATLGAPLIANVLADSILCESYKAKVASFARSELESGNLASRIDVLSSSLLPDRVAAAGILRTFAGARKAVLDTSLALHSCPWKP